GPLSNRQRHGLRGGSAGPSKSDAASASVPPATGGAKYSITMASTAAHKHYVDAVGAPASGREHGHFSATVHIMPAAAACRPGGRVLGVRCRPPSEAHSGESVGSQRMAAGGGSAP